MKRTHVWFIIPVLAVLAAGCTKEEIPTAVVSDAELPEGIQADVEGSDTPIFLAWEEAPELETLVTPKYPKEAKEDGTEGYVIVRLVIDEEGDVLEAKVVTSEPSTIFDEAAVEAAKQWKFKPATQKGQPIKVMLAQRVEFKMENRRL